MSDALIGQTVAGRFKLTGFIGEGAMATVYRGLQEAQPHDVAVKIMHPHLARDPTFSARFRREAKAAALLRHPNTVHIVDYGADRDRLYIAMELISGQDLFEMLVLERRFSESRAARIVAQVLDALTAAHSKGIVHRDLKPENVMVLPDPRDPRVEHVKVLDFGIAKILERDKAPSSGPESSSMDSAPNSLVASALTTVGVVVGTPAYMSPEQCRAEPVDARSDVYSCGILLYQLICGRTPFTGDSPIEIAINQVRMPPDPPSSVVPTIHPRLEQIILKSLEKWPAQRQQSAGEMRDELLAVLPQLSDDRQGVADGKQPPPPEVQPDDRALRSDDDVELVTTVRQESATAAPLPGPPAIIVNAAYTPPHQANFGIGAPPPTLAPRLPAGVGGPVITSSAPPSAPVSTPVPSSDPYSGPPSIEVFPRPFGPPIGERPPGPQMSPGPGAPPQGPATAPMPLTQRRVPSSDVLPSWLVLVIAILIGVGVGVVAHLVANR
jgi:serine/threonine protein kinase